MRENESECIRDGRAIANKLREIAVRLDRSSILKDNNERNTDSTTKNP